ncbi:MAG: CpsD/CapB family tyrosine-protein kinase [Gammaproteobacteria bacterium]
MTPEPNEHRAVSEEDYELHRALVLRHRLSGEAIERINELMERLHIRFAEAALHSGAITQEEIDAALEWIRERALRQGRSVVEEVLRKNVRNREVALWEPDKLTPDQSLILAHHPGHPRSERVRTLRTELLLRIKAHRRGGIFAVVSPGASEGRSQLAAELAIAFAQLGRQTLLVDADLRSPRQHLLFGSQNEYGLTRALGKDDVMHLHGIQGIPHMALLTSGTLGDNPLELLSGRRFENMLAHWRRTFEFVILDTPPTAQFSDGLAVATAAGAVLLVGRAAVTSFTALKEISRNLEVTQASVLGAVINRF